jgi:hypothetical protein
VDEGELAAHAARMSAKYVGLGPDMAAMPGATRQNYESNTRVIVKVTPERVRTWDFRKLRLPGR